MKYLPLPGQDPFYWARIYDLAMRLGFDGCTGVPDFYLPACQEHDYHYKYHTTLYGESITQEQADERFRQVTQHLSHFGIFSPMSWWRWIAVKFIGGFAWQKKTKRVG